MQSSTFASPHGTGRTHHFGVTMNPPIFNTFLFNAWNHKTRPSFELFMEQLPRHCSILRMVHGTINYPCSIFRCTEPCLQDPTHIQHLPPCVWNQMVHPCFILWIVYGTIIPSLFHLVSSLWKNDPIPFRPVSGAWNQDPTPVPSCWYIVPESRPPAGRRVITVSSWT